MKDLFFQEKGKQVLLTLAKRDNQYISEVSGGINSTFAHTFNLIKEMERRGIVSSAKEGRTKYVKLTPKGSKLASLIESFDRVMGSKKLPRKKSKKILRVKKSKLTNYIDALKAISKDIGSRRLSKRESGKFARLAGRYKALITKLRPKDKSGKEMKVYAMSLITEIEDMLVRKG